ncbi:MAG: hypothetical protein KF696_12515 [Planctomycetes bacterium]|nr:hypothetical protein [Planctomycetota bacterium]MCW8135912.1 hypothetical protein [Planctomycetota bacterium]
MWEELRGLGLEPFWPRRKLQEPFLKKGLLLTFGYDAQGNGKLLVSLFSIFDCCDVDWGDGYGQLFRGVRQVAEQKGLCAHVLIRPERENEHEGDYWYERCEMDEIINWVVAQSIDLLKRRQPMRRRNRAPNA